MVEEVMAEEPPGFEAGSMAHPTASRRERATAESSAEAISALDTRSG